MMRTGAMRMMTTSLRGAAFRLGGPAWVTMQTDSAEARTGSTPAGRRAYGLVGMRDVQGPGGQSRFAEKQVAWDTEVRASRDRHPEVHGFAREQAARNIDLSDSRNRHLEVHSWYYTLWLVICPCLLRGWHTYRWR